VKKVIVVGQGVVGATSAWRLAQAGYRVTILSTAQKKCASFAAHGVLCAQGHILPRSSLFAAKLKGVEEFQGLLEELENSSKQKVRSWWQGMREVFFSQAEQDKVLLLRYQRSFLGAFKLELQGQCRTGLIKPHDSSLFYPQAGWFCASDFMASLYQTHHNLGVESKEAQVLSFKEQGQKVVLEIKGQAPLTADYLVLATGADSQELLSASGFADAGLRYYYGETLIAKSNSKRYGSWAYKSLRLAQYEDDLFIGSSTQKLKSPMSKPRESLGQELQSKAFSLLKERPLGIIKHSGVRVANAKREPIFLPLRKNILFLSGFHKSGFLLADFYAKKVCLFFKGSGDLHSVITPFEKRVR
jgi:glycine/D-amino acid oxidase-like deaminating enzyme